MEEGRGVVARRWAGDVAALAPLATALLWLPGHDGGWGLRTATVLAVMCLPALVPAALEVARLARVAQWLLAAWSVGLLIGLGLAVHRADAVRPILEYAIAPVILLATLRILRRPWGPAVLLVGLLGAFGRYQYDAFLSWWGWSETGRARWAPLSWWNQSAALMGMLGALILGVTITSRRIVRVGLAALAATAFAGVWLSGSRAGMAVTAGAIVVTVVVASRSMAVGTGRWWTAMTTATASLAATALVVAGLLSILATTGDGTGSAGGRDRIARADQSLTQNTDARVALWRSAGAMWLDRPLTGQGVGSFGPLAFQWSDETSGLSSSAHNEYLEVLAEAGPLPALALVGVAVAAAGGVLGLTRRPLPRDADVVDLRAGLAAGGAGAAALFLVHAGVDFDWRYATLPSVAAIGLAAMMSARLGSEESTMQARAAGGARAVGLVGFGALVLLLVGGLAGSWWERRIPTSPDPVVAVRQTAPWDTSRAGGTALALMTAHRYPDAIDVLERARRWSPADPTLTTLLVQARFLSGDLTAPEAMAAIERHPTWLGLRAALASTLVEAGELVLAEQMLDRLDGDLEQRPSHLPLSARAAAAAARIRLVAATDGCGTAREVLNGAVSGGGMPANSAVELHAAFSAACGTSGHT